jgi:hypothetical protein
MGLCDFKIHFLAFILYYDVRLTSKEPTHRRFSISSPTIEHSIGSYSFKFANPTGAGSTKEIPVHSTK